MQILLENAIKHNEFSESWPLIIVISMMNDELMFTNKIHVKTQHKPSSKIGLQNLNERYRLITNKEIVVKNDGIDFTVYLPILPTN